MAAASLPPKHAHLIILGSGPAGYTAAIYAARAMLKPLLIQGIQPGGQLTITTDVENYPGFAKAIQGPWLMEEMKGQAEHVGTDIVMDHITSVDLKSRPFRLEGDSGDIYTCDALIICTGAQARWLGIPSEETFKGYGVSACATCDGFFYKNKDVVVVGGGNTAVEEAIFLTNFAKKVTIVHRRDHFRAEKILQDRLFKNPKIEVVWDSAVDEIVGTSDPKTVNAIKLKTSRPGQLPCAGWMAYSLPSAMLLRPNCSKASLKPRNRAISSPSRIRPATSIPGVYAAGDVKDEVYRQAVTAAGMGCMAALEAERWLASAASTT